MLVLLNSFHLTAANRLWVVCVNCRYADVENAADALVMAIESDFSALISPPTQREAAKRLAQLQQVRIQSGASSCSISTVESAPSLSLSAAAATAAAAPTRSQAKKGHGAAAEGTAAEVSTTPKRRASAKSSSVTLTHNQRDAALWLTGNAPATLHTLTVGVRDELAQCRELLSARSPPPSDTADSDGCWEGGASFATHVAELELELERLDSLELVHPYDRWGKRVDKSWSTKRVETARHACATILQLIFYWEIFLMQSMWQN
jgi:hypothetical protein